MWLLWNQPNESVGIQTVMILGDIRTALDDMCDGVVQTCVTSPPYFGLRDYGVDGQIGLEETPEQYVMELVDAFRTVRRVLADDGTLWLNLGDSYAGYHGNSRVPDDEAPSNKPGYVENMRQSTVGLGDLKQKDLMGIPWAVAFALRSDGWYLRSDIIWHKPNPMPESTKDRPTKAHEYLFLFSKQPKYYYDQDAIREPHVTFTDDSKMRGGRNHFGQRGGTPENGKNGGDSNLHDGRWDQAFHPLGRNRRTVWTINTKPYKGAHFAVMPEGLVEPCVLAGSSLGDTVLDPFAGSGTVGVVAKRLARQFVGVELNPTYVDLANSRIAEEPTPLGLVG